MKRELRDAVVANGAAMTPIQYEADAGLSDSVVREDSVEEGAVADLLRQIREQVRGASHHMLDASQTLQRIAKVA